MVLHFLAHSVQSIANHVNGLKGMEYEKMGKQIEFKMGFVWNKIANHVNSLKGMEYEKRVNRWNSKMGFVNME